MIRYEWHHIPKKIRNTEKKNICHRHEACSDAHFVFFFFKRIWGTWDKINLNLHIFQSEPKCAWDELVFKGICALRQAREGAHPYIDSLAFISKAPWPWDPPTCSFLAVWQRWHHHGVIVSLGAHYLSIVLANAWQCSQTLPRAIPCTSLCCCHCLHLS